MKYSTWQKKRLRDSLRAYYLYGAIYEDSGKFTWKDVAIAISDHVEWESDDDEISRLAERLRQFVDGIKTKNGTRRFATPKKKLLDAIVTFLTDEYVDLLTEDELQEFIPQVQGPIRFIEYLNNNQPLASPSDHSFLEGIYMFKNVIDNEFIVRHLILENVSDMGLIKVVEIEERFDKSIASQYSTMTTDDAKKVCKQQRKYGGWAILTTENSLIFYMKDELSNKNHFYFSLGINRKGTDCSNLSSLLLMSYKEPLFLSRINEKTIYKDKGLEYMLRDSIMEFEQQLIIS